jgi:N-acetylglucosamine-6-phosphate deacetylase
LELDALAEILQKKRWVHCHSYRQDEILALIRTFDDYGITIGSLQHILEGYKVADAMARHGATGSTFADWWAYKIEVYDAIPFNGALMHRQGVIVSFNSDDDELGRHLNHDAAKAMKYGGVPREEALKFVTLNPARQLRIDRWVGSLEAGKHADIVVWSGDPLSVRSRCQQTWIDGRKYFDREDYRELRAQQATMRSALIKKIIDSGQTTQSATERQPEEWELWPRHDEACHDDE